MAYAQQRMISAGTSRWYAIYFTPDGRQRSGGGFSTKRDAERAAIKLEQQAAAGTVADASRGKLTFAAYVEKYYWPAASTWNRPRWPLTGRTSTAIPPVLRPHEDEQDRCLDGAGLGQRRLRGGRGLRGQPQVAAGCAVGAEVPHVPARDLRASHHRPSHHHQPVRPHGAAEVRKPPKKSITPEQFETLLSKIPEQYRVLVLVAIETGVRWGELAALRPVDVDLDLGEIHVRRVVLEVSKKITGADKMWTVRDYPKDNEHRTIRIGDQLCQDIREYMMASGTRGEDLLFATSTGSPVSRNVFRTRVWLPAVASSKIKQRVRFHDLRGAHASWLLAGGADLKAVMDRLGHKQIQTTQQYLGRLPDAEERALKAFEAVRGRRP